MKKLFLLFFLIGLFFPFTSLASRTFSIHNITTGHTHFFKYEGIVPCGKCVEEIPSGLAFPAKVATHLDTQAKCEAIGYYWIVGECRPCMATYRKIDCSLCHLFAMVDGIVDLVLLKIVPPVATIIFLIGGISFYFAGGSPGQLDKAKKIIFSAIIGLVVIYTSWIIVNKTLDAIGIANWVGFGQGWYQIECEIEVETN